MEDAKRFRLLKGNEDDETDYSTQSDSEINIDEIEINIDDEIELAKRVVNVIEFFMKTQVISFVIPRLTIFSGIKFSG